MQGHSPLGMGLLHVCMGLHFYIGSVVWGCFLNVSNNVHISDGVAAIFPPCIQRAEFLADLIQQPPLEWVAAKVYEVSILYKVNCFCLFFNFHAETIVFPQWFEACDHAKVDVLALACQALALCPCASLTQLT